MKGGRKSRRRYHGGAQGAYPDSAWGFQLNNLGNGQQQFNDSLLLKPTENAMLRNSNQIVPVAAPVKVGGRRHRRRRHTRRRTHRRRHRGGNVGVALAQAAVPFGLIGLQRYTARRSRYGGIPSRHRRH